MKQQVEQSPPGCPAVGGGCLVYCIRVCACVQQGIDGLDIVLLDGRVSAPEARAPGSAEKNTWRKPPNHAQIPRENTIYIEAARFVSPASHPELVTLLKNREINMEKGGNRSVYAVNEYQQQRMAINKASILKKHID